VRLPCTHADRRVRYRATMPPSTRLRDSLSVTAETVLQTGSCTRCTGPGVCLVSSSVQRAQRSGACKGHRPLPYTTVPEPLA